MSGNPFGALGHVEPAGQHVTTVTGPLGGQA